MVVILNGYGFDFADYDSDLNDYYLHGTHLRERLVRLVTGVCWDVEILAERIEAWERKQNDKQTGIDWQFTTADARIKLRKLYPST